MVLQWTRFQRSMLLHRMTLVMVTGMVRNSGIGSIERQDKWGRGGGGAVNGGEGNELRARPDSQIHCCAFAVCSLMKGGGFGRGEFRGENLAVKKSSPARNEFCCR